jgi:ribonuclease D
MFKPKISKEEVNKLPIIEFKGKITIVEDLSEAKAAIKELEQSKSVGIDTETRPSFQRGTHHKVSLVQISSLEHCFLFRLNKMPFPEELGKFLSNDKIKKIGLALKDDFTGLNRLYTFKPTNFIDIQTIIKSYGILELGLQKIFAILFGYKISKTQRLTNWENETLTNQQQIYAATDAWTSLLIYEQLIRERKLSTEEVEKLVAEAKEEQELIRLQKLEQQSQVI